MWKVARTSLGLAAICVVGTVQVAVADSVQVDSINGTVIINGRVITPGGYGRSGEPPIIGDGKIASNHLPINAVDAVHLDGAFAAEINIGAAPMLSLEGDENILPVIKVKQTSDQIYIYPDHSYRTEQPIKMQLSLPSLRSLGVDGSNTVSAKGIEVRALAVTTNGANSVTISGHANALSVTLTGSGRFAASTLEADAVTIKISGSGSCVVVARRDLAAEVDGSGSIEVHGHPLKRSVRVNGSGSIQFAD